LARQRLHEAIHAANQSQYDRPEGRPVCLCPRGTYRPQNLQGSLGAVHVPCAQGYHQVQSDDANNNELYDDKIWAPAKLKIFAGELKTVPIESADYKETDNQLDVEWGVAQSDDATDDAIILVYYEATGETLYAIAKRGDVNTILDTTLLGAALDVTKLHVYLAFSQPPGEKYEHGQVSNTAYKQARSV
jgi:hypothetical protein